MQAWYYKFLVVLDGFLIALLKLFLELRLSRLSWCLFSLLLKGIELCLKVLVCGGKPTPVAGRLEDWADFGPAPGSV